jgi:hypothetical protein
MSEFMFSAGARGRDHLVSVLGYGVDDCTSASSGGKIQLFFSD